MSKYILDIGKHWEHNNKCPLCTAIDNQYEYISKLAKEPTVNKEAIQHEMHILEHMMINGYGLIDVYESNSIQHKLVFDKIQRMPSYTEDVVNSALNVFGKDKGTLKFNEYVAKEPTLIFSRFCRDCGARKPDIFDTECLKDFKNAIFTCELIDLKIPVDSTHKQYIDLKWNSIDYDFPYTMKIWKKVDNSKIDETTDLEGYKLLLDTDKYFETKDTELEDGRAYYYKLQYVNEFGMVFKELKTNVLVPCYCDHIPKNISNLRFIKHRKLVKQDDLTYQTYDTFRAEYDVDKTDTDFGEVIFKINEEHVPSTDYWYTDEEFKNHESYHFVNDKKRFFLKPYIKSRLFKKDWVNDHDIYPDLYFWNTSMPVQFFQYEPFGEDIYNVKFEDGKRSMKITYNLKIRNKIKYVRIMFKQSDKYITDDDDGTYKIVDVPAVHALYDYEVNITGLASNSYWVFGAFPVYENSDPDIRLEYQTIVKIRPWFSKDKWYRNPLDFYYIGKWYSDKDFDRYKVPSWDKISLADCRKKNVMMCDKIQMKDVAVLLIHDDDCSECFTLDFDFKMIAKTRQDRLHNFVNFQPQLKVVDTYDKWMSFERSYYNYEYMIIRWEQMKFADTKWTCTFIDNVHVHNETIVDTDTDNFTRTDTIKFKDFHYYNRTIKHNSLYQHTPKKFYGVDIVMNPYYDKHVVDKNNNGIPDDKEMIVVGNPDENFSWMP